jgi:hypothetical protein
VYDTSSEEEEAEKAVVAQPARTLISVGDYVHEEDEAVVAQVAAVSDAEARAHWRSEEADTVRQVREYEAARREERGRIVKLENVELDAE